MPTLTGLDGFEHKSTSSTGLAAIAKLYDNVAATNVSFESGYLVGSGVRIAQDGSNASRLQQLVNAGSASNYVLMSLWFKINTLPSGASQICYLLDSGNVNIADIVVNSGGTISARLNGGTASQTTAGTYNDGGWHLLDVFFDGHTNPWNLDWQIDGSAQTPVTNAAAAKAITSRGVGTRAAGGTLDVTVDHWVESVTAADYPVGAYYVVGSVPDGDGTHSLGSGSFSKSTGGTTDVWDVIDDWPSGSDYIQQGAADASAYLEFTFQDLAGWVTTVSKVRCVVVTNASGSTLDAGTLRLVDGSGTTIDNPINNLDLSNTAQQSNAPLVAAPGGGWASTFNGVKGRFGFSGNVATFPRLQSVMLEYATPDTPSGSDYPQAIDVTTTVTAAVTKRIAKTLAGVTTTLSVGLGASKVKTQAIAIATSLTAALKIGRGKAIAVTGSIAVGLATAVVSNLRMAISHTLASFRQRMRLRGSGTGFVPPDFTIDLHSAPIIGATFAGLRASWTADGPGALEVDLRPTDINDSWTPGAHQIILNWGGGPVFAGTIERLEQSGPPEDVRFTASALGLAARLDYRIVRHEFDVRDTVDTMVAMLLDEAQTQFNGDMGFSMGTVTGVTATRLRNYCFGVNIGDAIRELAQVGHGFDWEIDATGALNIWQNTRGVHTGKSLQDSDTNSWAVSADTGDTLTNVSSIGSQEQPFGPIHRLSYSPGLSTIYGRREEALDVDSTDETELFDSGDAELSTRAGARMQVNTMWIDDRGPWAFGEVWLQDIVSVVLPTYFGGTQDMRCTEINLSLEPGIHYYVEHTFEALCVDITQAQDDGA